MTVRTIFRLKNSTNSTISTTADTVNKYFVNITKKLKLKPTETEINELPLSEILDKYKDHQSIVKIRSQMNEKEFIPIQTCHV